MKRVGILIWAWASVLLAPVRSFAAGPTAAVLEFRAEGEVAPALRERLEQGLQDGLGGGGWIMPVSAVKSAVGDSYDGLKQCQEPACLAQLVKATGARVLVRAAARSEMEFYHMTISAQDGVSGRLMHTRSVDCEICTQVEATQALQTMAQGFGAEIRTMIDGLPKPAPSKRTLIISSKPTGASVFLDGEAVGKTEVSVEVEQGRHEIEVRKAGYVVKRTRAQIQPGEPMPLRFELEAAEPPPVFDAPDAPDAPDVPLAAPVAANAPLASQVLPPPELDASSPLSLAAFGTLGGGLALLAAGGVLIAKDGDSTCDNAPLQQCPTVYDTGNAGLVSVVLGGGAMLASVVLFLMQQDAAPVR